MRLIEAAEQFSFNPDQKRGWHGRWVHLADLAKDAVGKSDIESARRLDAHQRARDANPNRLDRLAERINARALERDKARHDAQVAHNLAHPKERKPGEYDNISKKVKRNLERPAKLTPEQKKAREARLNDLDKL